MRRVCIHQPDFIPYLGFFHRLLAADIFIIFDDAQFLRKGWHKRDRIRTKNGSCWLTLAVKKGNFTQRINEVYLSTSEGWISNNLNLIKENYKKAPYFYQHYPEIEEIYHRKYDKMIDLNLVFLNYFFSIFDIKIEQALSSKLNVRGKNNQKLINLIKAVDGTHYITGAGSREYLNEEMFSTEGIVVEWQDFTHPAYPQLYGEFIPNLSCIDILFNCGKGAGDILKSCLIKT